MLEYKPKKLSDIGDIVTGKTPPTSDKANYGDGYMFISPTELHEGFEITDSEKHITEKGLRTVKSNSIEGTSVLVGCIGWDMGNVAICHEKCVTNQQINSITHFKQGYNPYYVYYWLLTKKDYLFSIASVTRTPILSKSTFQDIIIPIPNKQQQDRITDVLFKIDKKIQCNKRINDNLQQMAYFTYMHLFYGKKCNGKLGDILVENPKSTIQVGEAKDKSGDYPFFTSGDAVLRWTEPIVEGRNTFLNTGGNADVKFSVGATAYSTDTWCITAKDDMEDYLYMLLSSIKQELNLKFFQGTGLKHLQKPLLKEKAIYIPSRAEISAFNADIMPWLTMVSENKRESHRLTALRDWLLPMLMNGQATISD